MPSLLGRAESCRRACTLRWYSRTERRRRTLASVSGVAPAHAEGSVPVPALPDAPEDEPDEPDEPLAPLAPPLGAVLPAEPPFDVAAPEPVEPLAPPVLVAAPAPVAAPEPPGVLPPMVPLHAAPQSRASAPTPLSAL